MPKLIIYHAYDDVFKNDSLDLIQELKDDVINNR